ncbi:MAG: GTPase [Hyphomicrobiales bacterium]
MEAGLDFADEADVATDVSTKARALVVPLLATIEAHLADRNGERLRDGVRIVIAGPPNAGKSRSLNALAKRDVAISLVRSVPASCQSISTRQRDDHRGTRIEDEARSERRASPRRSPRRGC